MAKEHRSFDDVSPLQKKSKWGMPLAALGVAAGLFAVANREKPSIPENENANLPVRAELTRVFEQRGDIAPLDRLNVQFDIEAEAFGFSREVVAEDRALMDQRIAGYKEKIKNGAGKFEIFTEILRTKGDYDENSRPLHDRLLPEGERTYSCINLAAEILVMAPHLWEDEANPETESMQLQHFSAKEGSEALGAHIRVLANIGEDGAQGKFIIEGDAPAMADYNRDIKDTALLGPDSLARVYAGFAPDVLFNGPNYPQNRPMWTLAQAQEVNNPFPFPEDLKTRPYVQADREHKDKKPRFVRIDTKPIKDIVQDVEAAVKSDGVLNLEATYSDATIGILLERYLENVKQVNIKNPSPNTIISLASKLRNSKEHMAVVLEQSEEHEYEGKEMLAMIVSILRSGASVSYYDDKNSRSIHMALNEEGQLIRLANEENHTYKLANLSVNPDGTVFDLNNQEG